MFGSTNLPGRFYILEAVKKRTRSGYIFWKYILYDNATGQTFGEWYDTPDELFEQLNSMRSREQEPLNAPKVIRK